MFDGGSQALQYLRKLCSHPLLVLEDKRQAARHADAIAQSGSKDLHELQHAPKLQALRDILEECGIGMPAAAETTVGAEGGQHRVLVFAQLKVLVLYSDLLVQRMCYLIVTGFNFMTGLNRGLLGLLYFAL